MDLLLRGGEIKNCHNINTTVILKEGENYTVGGIVGQAGGNVSNCSNSGTIQGKGVSSSSNTQVGGIVGLLKGNLSNCSNSGTVTGAGARVGGIIGTASEEITIKNCNNTGSVTGGTYVGGIAGYVGNGGNVSFCSNKGKIEGLSVINRRRICQYTLWRNCWNNIIK